VIKKKDQKACRKVIEKELRAKKVYPTASGFKGAVTGTLNELFTLIDRPDRYLWVTIFRGYLYWCTARRKIIINPNINNYDAGYIWVPCDRPWTNLDLKRRPLILANLPGTVGAVAGFQGVIGKPRYSEEIMRVINGEPAPAVEDYKKAQSQLKRAISELIPMLHWKDFELLVDLLFNRAGWVRVSSVGTEETVDMEIEHPENKEHAFVQVKAAADQKTLNKYIAEYRQLRHDRMFFVCHSPRSELSTDEAGVIIWDRSFVADLVVRRGLAEWVAQRIG